MLVEEIFRPRISVIRVTPDHSGVEVVLEMEGQQSTGYAPTDGDGLITTAARSTLVAVTGLLDDPLSLELAWAELHHPEGADRAVVNVGVEVDRHGDDADHLLGAAYVHSEEAIAAVRATLDGLTRRLAVGEVVRASSADDDPVVQRDH